MHRGPYPEGVRNPNPGGRADALPAATVGRTVRSVALAPGSAAAVEPLLSLLPPDEAPVAWVRRGEGLIGWGVAARAEFFGPERFSRAHRWWHGWAGDSIVDDRVRLPGSGPVAFGSFAFDGHPGRSVVVVPRVLVGRRGGRTWVTTVDEAAPVLHPYPEAPVPAAVQWRPGAMAPQTYSDAVAIAVGRIAAGEVDKVVLARDLVADVTGPLDSRFIMGRLDLDYPECWTFSVDGLVGATPELLVRRAGGLVTSRVLAGTVRRRGNGRDAADAAALLASDKDLVEHGYAVASVAEALATHCTDLDVPASPAVLQLANVQHLATDVRGRLADDTSALALAASLHPTAAVCGTPTERAMGLIRDLETMDRGRYAGPVGWVDSRGDGEFGIALRCGEVDPDAGTVRIFAGCGIVAGSTPEAELAESTAKFAAMRGALTPGARRD